MELLRSFVRSILGILSQEVAGYLAVILLIILAINFPIQKKIGEKGADICTLLLIVIAMCITKNTNENIFLILVVICISNLTIRILTPTIEKKVTFIIFVTTFAICLIRIIM